MAEQQQHDKAPTTDQGQDAGGKAHTGLDEGHPGGVGERDDRTIGGPTVEEGAPPESDA
jgi:hypothetical protein